MSQTMGDGGRAGNERCRRDIAKTVCELGAQLRKPQDRTETNAHGARWRGAR